MKKAPFTGSGVALVTPFDKNNKINYCVLEELIEMHISNKTDAIIVCGTTGEASVMDDDEHMSVVEFAVKKVNGRVPVIAGCGSNDTNHAVRFSKMSEELGADALLSVTPYYNKANKSGLSEHYRCIAKSVNIPIILYNVPSRTGVNISIEILKNLSELENIVAIKEASGNVGYAAQIASEIPDLYIYSGNDDITIPILSVGGIGVISVAANIIPKEMHYICEQYRLGNVGEAKDILLKYMKVINNLFCEVNPVPIKEIMNYLGYDVGKVRLPLGKMEKKNLEKLIREVNNVGIKKYRS
ncbi:MAG: 4-hydroxy-tetrahydrodipicolinate synthase [Clostridia bacterium]|nr:4-hydroxy-tetrahydrodipicolinate synthase [Clostridia bacterium]